MNRGKRGDKTITGLENDELTTRRLTCSGSIIAKRIKFSAGVDAIETGDISIVVEGIDCKIYWRSSDGSLRVSTLTGTVVP